jgi:hypothetical protein
VLPIFPEVRPLLTAEGCKRLQAETETTVSPADAKDTVVQIPPRGTERPQDFGRETENPPTPGTESGTPAGDRLIDLLAIVATLPPRSIALLADLARLLAARQEKDSPGTRTP